MAPASPQQPPRALLEAAADEIATERQIDPQLFRRLITQESGWDTHIVSPKGAVGLGQLMPGTAKDLGVTDPTNGLQNLRGAATHYRRLLDQYGGDQLQALAAYNWGEGNLASGKKAPQETRDYVKKILGESPLKWTGPTAPAVEAPRVPGARRAPVPGAAGSPLAAEAPPAPVPDRPSYAAQFASGVPEGAAGVVDLPATVTSLAGGPELPRAGNLVAPHVAAEPQTFPERLVRSAGRGVGATLALGPVLFASGATLPAVATTLAYGAASGVTAEAARTGVAAVGGGPKSQLAAELVGGALAPGAVAAGRFTKGVYGARLAAKDAVATSQAALVVAKEAAKAEAIATSAPVADAQTIAKGATALATQQEAATAHAIDSLLVHQDPADRAKMVTAVIQHRDQAGRANISESYTAFTQAMDQRGVAIDLPDLRLTSKEIVRDAQDIGLSSDQAQNAADRIIELTQPRAGVLLDASGRPQPVTVTRNKASVAQMIALRSEIGAIYNRATRGAVQHRAGLMRKAIDRALDAGLPDDARATWRTLNASRRLHGEIFEAKVVEKALGDTDAGRQTAGALVAKYLEKPWDRDDAIEVGQLLRATGTNTVGHDILKDGFLRRAVEKVTHPTTGQIDYGRLTRQLTNPEGLAPVFRSLVTDPRERALVIRTVREAARGREWAAAAEAHVGTETARAGRLAERGITAAERGVQTAQGRVSPGGALTSLPTTVLDLMWAGGAFHLGGAKAVAIGSTLRTGATLIAWLRQPQNQAFVRKASRTVADSTTGRRMLQGLGTGAATGERTALPMLGGPQAVAADEQTTAP